MSSMHKPRCCRRPLETPNSTWFCMSFEFCARAAISLTITWVAQLALPIYAFQAQAWALQAASRNPHRTHLVLHVLQAWGQVLQLGQLLDLGSHRLPCLPQPGLSSLSSLLQDLLLAFKDAGLHSMSLGLLEGAWGVCGSRSPDGAGSQSLLQGPFLLSVCWSAQRPSQSS